jgi:hypothetical protein
MDKIMKTETAKCKEPTDVADQSSLYRSQHELVFGFKSGKRAHRNDIQLGQFGRYRTNVWQYRQVNSLAEMVADAILDCTARGDVVLDPFLGSGTTLIAAERTGRVCFGIELEPRYVNTIIRGGRSSRALRLFTTALARRLPSARMRLPMPYKDDDSGYEIGFGKPPKHSRFHKGLSGNPKGRPKGTRNLATVLERTLREKVVISENGVHRTVSKLEAAARRLVDKAAAGDLAALRQLTALAGSPVEQVVDASTNQLADADLEIMRGVLKRLEGCSKEEESND